MVFDEHSHLKARSDDFEPLMHVIAGPVPAIPMNKTRCSDHRDRRDKPGHDDPM
jgi:hypothetical protein